VFRFLQVHDVLAAARRGPDEDYGLFVTVGL